MKSKETQRKQTPEERLRDAIRERLTPEWRIEAARRLIEKGEKLDRVLFLYPEYGEVKNSRGLKKKAI